MSSNSEDFFAQTCLLFADGCGTKAVWILMVKSWCHLVLVEYYGSEMGVHPGQSFSLS